MSQGGEQQGSSESRNEISLEAAACLRRVLDEPWAGAISGTFWESVLPFLVSPELSGIWKRFYFFSNVGAANFEIFLF